MRAKYVGKPELYMESELDLDEDIRKFGEIALNLELLNVLTESTALSKLILLINHENLDISIDVLLVFSDLLTLDISEKHYEALKAFI